MDSEKITIEKKEFLLGLCLSFIFFFITGIGRYFTVSKYNDLLLKQAPKFINLEHIHSLKYNIEELQHSQLKKRS
jgi:uncharacterized protein YneF (UPF0154 family)